MGPLDLVQLTALMDRTSGRAEISVTFQIFALADDIGLDRQRFCDPWNVKLPVTVYCWSVTFWTDLLLKLTVGNCFTFRKSGPLISLFRCANPVSNVSVLTSSATADLSGESGAWL